MATNDERMLRYLEQIASQGKEKGPSLGLNSSADDFKKALTLSKDKLKDFADEAKGSLNTWRDLSKTGAAFSNDIIGMSTAAAQSRVSLEDFAQVIRDNGKYMTGLGGSVGRGAEVFSKLSKSFFESNMDRGLRELGYTSKELNDVLALTAGAQKSAFADTEAGQKRTNEAAASMAKEMDLIAKLTGKSRQEQMEEMTKRKVDGQAEAKLRLLTAGKSEEESAKIRNEYQKGLLEAQKQGTEQAYKEYFATGTYLSETAATQAALLGKQARAQEESIQAMQGGDFAKAAEARERSASESLKNQTNTALLQIATLGDAAGPAGEAMVKQVEANDAFYHSVNKVKKEYESQTGTMISWSEALKITREKIEQEQAGRDKNNKAVSGATEGMIAVEKAQQDFKAGLAGAAEAVDKEGKSLANALRDTGTVVKNVIQEIEGTTVGGNIGKNIRQRAEAGMQGETVKTDAAQGKLKAEEAKRQGAGGVVGGITKTASDVANEGVATAAKAIGSVVGPDNPIGPMGGKPLERRALGGPVSAATPYLVGEGGKPEIFVPKVAGDIVPMDKVGTSSAPMASSGSSINVAEISKTISTTISSVVGGGSTTTSRVQSDESKSAEKELQSIKEQYAAERTTLAAKFKEMMPGSSVGDRRRAMNASDESKELNAKYDALMKPLEKKIEDGITFEVEKKQAVLEETKKAVTEELAVIKQGNLEQLSIKTMTEDQIAKTLEASGKDLNDFYIDMNGDVKAFAEDTIKSVQSTGASGADLDMFYDQGPAATSKLDLNKFNIPGISFGSANSPKDPNRSVAQGTTEAAEKIKKEEEAKKAAAEKAKKEEEAKKASTSGQGKTDGKTGPSSQKAATLDDVVKSLDMLNMKMGQLISQQSDLVKRQTSAMIASTSNNVYDKTR